MNFLSQVWPLPLGFFAGLVATPLLFRWLLLLLASLGRLPPNLGTSAQRPQKSGIFLTLTHPVPWLLLAGVIFGVPPALASAARAEWGWFLAGILAAPSVNASLVYMALRRARARR
ncbi:MAG: hypothetical protein WCH32_05065 [Pseudomonadota bacterium]